MEGGAKRDFPVRVGVGVGVGVARGHAILRPTTVFSRSKLQERANTEGNEHQRSADSLPKPWLCSRENLHIVEHEPGDPLFLPNFRVSVCERLQSESSSSSPSQHS